MRKRSNYRHKAVVINPLNFLQPAPKDERERLEAVFFSALASMTSGTHPGEEDWRLLSDAINTVETLATDCGQLNPHEVMPIVNAAIAAMVSAAKRFRAGQGMRLDGEGIKAIRDVLDVYLQCLESLTGYEMGRAREATAKRLARLIRERSAELVSV